MTTFKNMKQTDHIKNIVKLTCEEIIDAIDTDLRILANYKSDVAKGKDLTIKEHFLDFDLEDYEATIDWQTISKEDIVIHLMTEFTNALPSIVIEYYKNERNKTRDEMFKQHHMWDGEKTFA